jgi:hypothetical protein
MSGFKRSSGRLAWMTFGNGHRGHGPQRTPGGRLGRFDQAANGFQGMWNIGL